MRPFRNVRRACHVEMHQRPVISSPGGRWLRASVAEEPGTFVRGQAGRCREELAAAEVAFREPASPGTREQEPVLFRTLLVTAAMSQEWMAPERLARGRETVPSVQNSAQNTESLLQGMDLEMALDCSGGLQDSPVSANQAALKNSGLGL